jgi:hypothetical protein
MNGISFLFGMFVGMCIAEFMLERFLWKPLLHLAHRDHARTIRSLMMALDQNREFRQQLEKNQQSTNEAEDPADWWKK